VKNNEGSRGGYGNKASVKIWEPLVNVQDEEYTMNIEVDIALRNIYNQRNPHFEMFKFRDEFPLAAKQNYLPKDASAAKRIDLI
jgi:hypothetical protein